MEIPKTSTAQTKRRATSRTRPGIASSLATGPRRHPHRARRVSAAIYFSAHITIASDQFNCRKRERSEEARAFALVLKTPPARRADHATGLHVVVTSFSSANAIVGGSHRRTWRQICD